MTTSLKASDSQISTKETIIKKLADKLDDSSSDEDDLDEEELEELEALDYVIVEPQPEGRFSCITNKIFGNITGSSAAKQFTVGGVFGCVTGYLGLNVGKLAAAALGSCLLLLQIAQHNGYISIDWTKVKHALTKTEAKVRKAMIKRKDLAVEKSKSFFEENTFLASGFVTGVIISMFI